MQINHTKNPGILYIVATPIGNLKDITLRALEVLQAVDVIACEDTRHSQKLLHHYNIKKPLLALHEHNETKRVNIILEALQHGQNLAVISDAGTPLISDPGYKLVAAAYAQKLQVIPIPGPCAAITALSAAGLPSDSFRFIGFPPAKKSAKDTLFKGLQHDPATLIFYEAPHRLLATLDSISDIFAKGRPLVIAKELTKLYEHFYTATTDTIKTLLPTEELHGEFVILIAGKKIALQDKPPLPSDNLLKILLEELPTKQAVKLAAQITGISKNLLYQKALEISKN